MVCIGLIDISMFEAVRSKEVRDICQVKSDQSDWYCIFVIQAGILRPDYMFLPPLDVSSKIRVVSCSLSFARILRSHHLLLRGCLQVHAEAGFECTYIVVRFQPLAIIEWGSCASAVQFLEWEAYLEFYSVYVQCR